MALEKKRVCARMNGGKPVKNIANYGIKKNGIASVDRHGEYFGLVIQVLEDVKPLFTNYVVGIAFQKMEIGDIVGAYKTLGVNNPSEAKYVMVKWLSKYGFSIPNFIKDIQSDDEQGDGFQELTKRIELDRSRPIECKFKIIDIGCSKKKQPVVPDDWIGKKFNSATELHSKMDELEWRKDKPKVMYCCTYGMVIRDDIKWSKISNDSPTYLFGIHVTKYRAYFTNFGGDLTYSQWIKSLPTDIDTIDGNGKYIIACNKEQLFNKNVQYTTTLNVGLLVSRMQKCIRRGSVCANLLLDTIKLLNKCRPYNLPEHNFLKVSGSKQLLWRLYISTIEDSSVYRCDETIASLEFIFALALICHNDGNLQLNDTVIEILTKTAIKVQEYDKLWDWRSGKQNGDNNTIGNNQLINSMICAIAYMPMMRGDALMLRKSIAKLENGYNLPYFSHISESEIDDILNKSDYGYEEECMRETIDMHCFPNITLLVQASLPFVGKQTTQMIPKLIWEYLSKNSFRYPQHMICSRKIHDTISTVSRIQEYIHINGTKNFDTYSKYDNYLKSILHKTTTHEMVIDDDMNKHTKRLAFLLIFGRKYHMGSNTTKFKSADIIVGGNEQIPLKIKISSVANKHEYLMGTDRFNYERKFLETFEQPMKIELPDAPEGYVWKFDKSSVYIQMKLNNSDTENLINHISFYIDNAEIPAFDGSSLLLKVNDASEIQQDQFIDVIIKQALYCDTYFCDDFDINILMRHIWTLRNTIMDYDVYNWATYLEESKIPEECLRILYSRITSNTVVDIGPVDRSGNKTLNSISYEYEGTLWRLMNLLAMLYPETVQLSGTFKFIIDKSTTGYKHLIKNIQNKENIQINGKMIPKIITELWDHQKASSDKIYNGIVDENKLGHCDASCVGSGKTLVAIDVISRLMKHDAYDGSKGALILLPTEKLYMTWINEINKHTKDFSISTQSANGDIDKKICFNTIVITTLGRMRDHPIIHKWLYVVVDECLSVQNSSSLHTEEAWRQVTNSKYGVLLLSASFFRSRFDKLLYMLRMLRTGLPEDVEFLDTILNESMVCYIGDKKRKWKTEINKYSLPVKIKEKYDKILSTNDDYETKYIGLSKLMFNECDYISCFKSIIKKIEKIKDVRALIYARSKKEADTIAGEIDNVSRYPDKTKRHTVVSYAEGTYGLNDLVIYNTIISRPPEADKLPQMKGRLDRPNQKNDVLNIEYLIFENTIEEAMIFKLEMCKKFHGQYILPLAEFYKMAVEETQH